MIERERRLHRTKLVSPVGYAIAVTPQWNKRRLLLCNAHPAALVLPDGWQGFLSRALGGHGYKLWFEAVTLCY
jgi:hypothetical protein